MLNKTVERIPSKAENVRSADHTSEESNENDGIAHEDTNDDNEDEVIKYPPIETNFSSKETK